MACKHSLLIIFPLEALRFQLKSFTKFISFKSGSRPEVWVTDQKLNSQQIVFKLSLLDIIVVEMTRFKRQSFAKFNLVCVAACSMVHPVRIKLTTNLSQLSLLIIIAC